MKRIIDWLNDEEGATAVEYAVMLALILAVIIGAIGMLGAESGSLWDSIDDDLNAVNFGSN